MRKKLENFWYYNKLYVAIGAFAVLSVVIAMLLTGKSAEPDVQIGYVTDGRQINEETREKINSYFEKVMQDVNNDDKKMMSFVPLMGPRVDMEFTSDGVQILLMDGNTLQKYKDQGVLEPLDGFVKKHGLDVSANTEVVSRPEGQKEEHIIALPMNKIKFLLDQGFPGEDYYLTVRVEYNKNETSVNKNRNAYAVMDAMLDYNEV